MLSPCAPTQTAKQAQGQEKKRDPVEACLLPGSMKYREACSRNCTLLYMYKTSPNAATYEFREMDCKLLGNDTALAPAGRKRLHASSALRGGHHVLEGVEGLGSGVGVEGVHALEQGIGHSTVDEAGKAVVDVHDGLLRHGGDHAAQGCIHGLVVRRRRDPAASMLPMALWCASAAAFRAFPSILLPMTRSLSMAFRVFCGVAPGSGFR